MGGEDHLLKQRNVVAKNGNKKMSTLLFWQGRKGSPSPGGRTWIHQPDLLVKGHVAYLVKYLGSIAVDQPKGIEVVKEAIKKLNFNQQLKAKENSKCKKVEITISVDGVAIQEPRTNNILHQFPLHRISYCADDKGAKKYFSFIAKDQPPTNGLTNGNSHEKERHECFVFVSTKLAAEITLTIGQAFDLAYRRFINDNGKYMELKKIQLQNKKLELQVTAYRTRLLDLARLAYKDDLQGYLNNNSLSDITEFKTPPELAAQITALSESNTSDLGLDLSGSLHSNDTFNSTNESNNLLLDTSPQSNHVSLMSDLPPSKNPSVGTRLEGLLLDSDDSDFDPRAYESAPPTRPDARETHHDVAPPPLIAPPPKASKRQNGHTTQTIPTGRQNGVSDLFGSAPFSAQSQQSFAPANAAPLTQNSPFAMPSGPNYDSIRDVNIQSTVFDTANTFTNGLTSYDPFDTRSNGFNGNGFSGFGGLSEKQSVALDSSFSGFLDKRINEMKEGFRGISFGNDDFNIDHLDPLKKN